MLRTLLFLQRAALICNFFFIIVLMVRHIGNFLPAGPAQTIVIILGFFLSFILNAVVNLWEGALLFNRKIALGPQWLRTTNFIVFIFQIFYFLLS